MIIKMFTLQFGCIALEGDEMENVLKVNEQMLTLKTLNISEILNKASNLLSSKENKYNHGK